MLDTATHRCIPIVLKPCSMCGEPLAALVFCENCGENITAQHVCNPEPLAHTCTPHETASRCLKCGDVIPAARFCVTCGERLEAFHQCASSGLPVVLRAPPIHVCRAQPLPHCDQCGALVPPLTYCEICGMDITAQHVCQSRAQAHTCAPSLLMPRPCPRCGETLPARTHCNQCGKEITATHVCAKA